MANIKVRDEAHWHELRSRHIGSSEVAALFNESRFKTAFELYHEKKGSIEADDLRDNERVVLGQFLEPGIAQVFAHLHDLKIRKVHRYIVHDTIRGLGGSLDFEALWEGKWIPFEVKMTDYSVWKVEWTITNDQNASTSQIMTAVEPPLDYDLQVQHQLLLTGAKVALIGVLAGGTAPYLCLRARHEPVVELIQTRVERFWNDFANDIAPPISSGDDLAAVRKLYAEASSEPVADLRNHDIEDDLVSMKALNEEIKAREERRDFHKARIINALGDSTKGTTENFMVGCPSIHRPEKKVERIDRAITYRGGITFKPLTSKQKDAA